MFWEIGWGAAEVEVDPGTGIVKVLKLVASGDTGRSINPLVCKGQEDGAAVQGYGQALFERWVKHYAVEIGRPKPTVSTRALVRLAEYPWPGNVAELKAIAPICPAARDRISARRRAVVEL